MPSLASSSASSVSGITPHVSFIVPLYNCLALTQAMLASLLATLPPDLAREIIFVDDGSTDGTRAWLTTLGEGFQVILQERNQGYANANNAGAAVARGELLVLLNNDLLLTRHWLPPLLATHRALGARAGLIGNVQRNARTGEIDHAGIFFDHTGKPEHARTLPVPWIKFIESFRAVEAVTGACVLVAREQWNRLGGFDPGYVNGGEDVDLCLRAQAAGLVNAIAWRSVVRHHVSASPGRKLRDEENTRRFVTRWQVELARRAVRRWCQHYCETCSLEPRDHEYLLAARIGLHAASLTRQPPAEAQRRTAAAIGAELAHWDRLLSGETQAESPAPPERPELRLTRS